MENSKTLKRNKLFIVKLIFAISILFPTIVQPHGPIQTIREQFYLAFNRLPKEPTFNDYFGERISDPYQWIEKSSTMENWFEQNNLLTKFIEKNIQITENLFGRRKEQIIKEIEKLQKFDRFSIPVKRNRRYFYLIKKIKDKQPALYISNARSLNRYSTNGEMEFNSKVILFDPNLLDKSGNTTISNFFPNHDGSAIAIQLTTKGQDFSNIKILNINNLYTCAEELHWCPTNNFSLVWGTDNQGFYYNSNIRPETNEKGSRNIILYHKPRTQQPEDIVVFENDSVFNKPSLSNQGLIITSGTKLSEFDLYIDQTNVIGNLRTQQTLSPFASGNHKNIFIGSIGSNLYVQSNRVDSGEIILINSINKQQTILIPEKENFVIDKAIVVNKQIIVSYMHNVHNELHVFDLNGNPLYEIKLPVIGSVLAFSAENESDNELFIEFASFVYPRTTLRFDFETKQINAIWPTNKNINFDNFEMEQVFYTSKDGTRVPMFIMHKKEIKLNGNNPTLMYGYGGLGVNLKPSTLPSPIFYWLQQGGIYVIPSIRGGGEFGKRWHKAGKLFNKQNVFDDFIYAAKTLIQLGYTSPNKLAIQGTCNGGLLVLMAMIQAPELFGAVVAQVPLADMLRYDLLGNTKRYIPEFGSAKNSLNEFKNLKIMSPMHNIQSIIKHSPLLISIYQNDDHITPAQPLKMFATLREINRGKTYIHFGRNMGHYGKGNRKSQNEESATILSFLFKTLEVN